MAIVLAHAQGTLLDLAVPLPAVLFAAAGTVVATGAWLTRRDDATHVAPSRRDPAWTLPRALMVGTARMTRALRVAAVVVLAFLVAVAVAGSDDAARNPLPRVLLVLVWGGLVPVSVLFGPVYGQVNPLRPLAGALRRLAGITPNPAGPPAAIGRRPAAAFAVLFCALSQFGTEALPVASVTLLVYVGVQVAAGTVWGDDWFRGGDAFEVLSDVLGAIAPWGPRRDGRVGLRDPLLAVGRAPTPPGTLALVGVLVGATYFEAVAEAWSITGWPAGLLGTAASGALATGVLRLGVVRPFLAPAVLPVAAAYGLQLYLVPLLLDGRIALSQVTDPFGRSATLPELVARGVQLPVADAAVAWLLLLVFVSLHAVAVVVAHRAALARFDLRGARAVQFPLRAVLLASVVIGLFVPTLGS